MIISTQFWWSLTHSTSSCWVAHKASTRFLHSCLSWALFTAADHTIPASFNSPNIILLLVQRGHPLLCCSWGTCIKHCSHIPRANPKMCFGIQETRFPSTGSQLVFTRAIHTSAPQCVKPPGRQWLNFPSEVSVPAWVVLQGRVVSPALINPKPAGPGRCLVWPLSRKPIQHG